MLVLIADDQAEVRSAMRLLLEQQGSIEVVGEARNAALLVALVCRIHPDVVLLDWELPGLPAGELVEALRDIEPEIRVVALSGQPEAAASAIDSGADTFACKCDPPEIMLEALLRSCQQNQHETPGRRTDGGRK
jgi:DNA-binding NarL/FixJ family response regulator